MPGRDRTGPNSTGPVGRRLGPCGGAEQEIPYQQSYGMGVAYRRGRRFGNRQSGWGWRIMIPEDEKQHLKNQHNWLKEQLDAVSRRIEELKESSD